MRDIFLTHFQLQIKMNDPAYTFFILEKHEKSQSRHNYILAPGRRLEYMPTGTYTNSELYMEETNRILKSDYVCNQDNSNEFSTCIDQFKEQHLGCRLPWKKGELEPCAGQEKLDEFRNLSMSIIAPEIQEKIKQAGCFVQNCRERKWQIQYSQSHKIEGAYLNVVGPNVTIVSYLLSGNDQVVLFFSDGILD